MLVHRLIKKQKDRLLTCRPDDSIKVAAVMLRSNHIGALPVCDADRHLKGVISERDIVRGVADSDAQVLEMTVAELMTAEVITCAPDDDIRDALRLMFKHKIRHLPVVDEGQVCGMVSLRAAMESRLRRRRWSGGHATQSN
jgi:CBS domain-containing protein